MILTLKTRYRFLKSSFFTCTMFGLCNAISDN